MEWIFIAVVSSTLMTAPFSTEEACLGRKAIIEKEYKIINAKCVNMPPKYSSSVTSCCTLTIPGVTSQ